VSRRRARRAFLFAIALLAFAPAVALAHPLGNFTINHFAALRIGTDRVSLDVVIDRAEIPTFQERQALDTDGDGTVGPTEVEAARQAACASLASDLRLVVGGAPVALTAGAAGLSFPAGAGGLPTMRLVCEYTASLASPLASGTTIAFEDRSFAERIGWREIVVAGDGAAVVPADGSSLEGVSTRLTAYPTGLIAQPLDQRSISVTASPGGPALPAWSVPDAAPLLGSAGAGTGTPSLVSAVPGGIGTELASIIDARDLSPAVIFDSLLVAVALGAIHAISPGHGKTIMAAYLVGTRGTARHAVGLGLTVTVSHTLGVLALAAVTLLAANVLPPERLYPILGVASGGLVIAIGGSLLLSRLRAVRASRRTAAAHELAHAEGHDHDHEHEPHHEHEPLHQHEPAGRSSLEGLHSHGGRAHSHLPPAGTTLSWRSLFTLGLAGGLVPSASALILLLGSISAGRVAYGIVLVVGFGLGMAVVLGGVGLALVRASHLLERVPRAGGLGRLGGAVQLGTAGVVIILGVFLTSQALTQVL
jgi:ABC-type nickel/cobalt efflux system permease component RcnA